MTLRIFKDPPLSMLVDPPDPRRKIRPRWLVLLALVVAALVLHWLLLNGLLIPSNTDNARPLHPATSVQVRAVVPAAVPPPVKAESITTVAQPKAVKRALPLATVEPVTLPAPAPSPAVAEPTAPYAPLPNFIEPPQTSVEVVAVAPAHHAAAEPEVPLYRTVMPPAMTLHYGLQRGMWSGTGDLVWRPSGDHYEARLEGYVAGLRVITQISQGGFDHAGIAPLRFTDQRLRQMKAANFQRDKGKLTYSGASTEFPLVPGAQDRLSWMIQLAAVLNAEPHRAEPGGKVAMFVTGVRADADVWVFSFVKTESVHTDEGNAQTVKFAREPRRAYDTSVEVWLDLARHYLPVRAKLTSAPSGESFELLLRSMQ